MANRRRGPCHALSGGPAQAAPDANAPTVSGSAPAASVASDSAYEGLTYKQLQREARRTPGVIDKKKTAEGEWFPKSKEELIADLRSAAAQPLAGPRTAEEKKAPEGVKTEGVF